MEDEDSDESLAELYAIERAADSVESGEDFIEFLGKLQA